MCACVPAYRCVWWGESRVEEGGGGVMGGAGLHTHKHTNKQTNKQTQKHTGPLALLPVRGGYSNIVWSTSIDHAAQLEALSPEQFAAAVNAALTAPPTGPSSFPSSSHGGGVIQRAVSRVLSTMGIGTGTGTGMGMGGLHDAYHPPPRVLAWVGKQPASFPLVVNQALQYVAWVECV